MHFSYEQYEGFSRPMEGRVTGMYCDILGLITCAVGNMIDSRAGGYPKALVESIHWTLADGSPAPAAVVRADWQTLKADCMRFAKLHWKYALAATRCRLTEPEIDRIVRERLAINEAAMRKVFAYWDLFPADAQLVVMSMCWAVGTGWPVKFPRFAALMKAMDWEAAARFDDPSKPKGNWPGKIRETGNPGIVPRNLKNRFCLLNAAIVKEAKVRPEHLWWPDVAEGTQADRGAALMAAADLKAAALQALELSRYESPSGGRAVLDDEAQS